MMRKILLLSTLVLTTAVHAQINFGAAPEVQEEKVPVYDGKHNIVSLPYQGEYRYVHLIGESVTYLGMNDEVNFVTNDSTPVNPEWPYKFIDSTPYKFKSFRIVDAGKDYICFFDQGSKDSIFVSGDLNTNFIVQKHYDLAKRTCVGKTYRETGASRRLGFFRDYNTRRPFSAADDNSIPSSEDLKCIDVFVDTVHYDTSMSDDNKYWAENVETISGSRLCLLFETPHYGKIFCPVEEAEVLDPKNARNWMNMGPVLTEKPHPQPLSKGRGE